MSFEYISTNFIINGFQYKDGEIHKRKAIDNVLIKLKDYVGLKTNENTLILERIGSNDIAQIHLVKPNKKSITYYPLWNGENKYTNKYQTSELYDKYLIITIMSKE